jgi:hypothetical protein
MEFYILPVHIQKEDVSRQSINDGQETSGIYKLGLDPDMTEKIIVSASKALQPQNHPQ